MTTVSYSREQYPWEGGGGDDSVEIWLHFCESGCFFNHSPLWVAALCTRGFRRNHLQDAQRDTNVRIVFLATCGYHVRCLTPGA
jgi:hypothetical protein